MGLPFPSLFLVHHAPSFFPQGTETNFEDLKCPLPGLSAAQKLLCQGTPDSFEMQPPQMLLLFFIMLQELGLFSALEVRAVCPVCVCVSFVGVLCVCALCVCVCLYFRRDAESSMVEATGNPYASTT